MLYPRKHVMQHQLHVVSGSCLLYVSPECIELHSTSFTERTVESQTSKEAGINNHPPSLKQQFSVKCLDRKTIKMFPNVFLITGKNISNLSYSAALIL